MSNVGNCPCGASNSYKQCCQKYHTGQNARTALLLMKSRYCAFAKGQIDYIVKTTHPENPSRGKDLAKWKRELQDFSKSTLFKELEILEVQEGDETSFVTFKVDLIQQGQRGGFTEKSEFKKMNGRWLYLNGTILVPGQ